MGSIKVSIIAVVATLTPLLALAPNSDGASSGAPQPQTVECKDPGVPVTVSAPGSTVKIECQPTYTFYPAVIGDPEKQDVCSEPLCGKQKKLTDYCPNARLEEVKPAQPEVIKAKAPLEAAGNAKEEVAKPAATLKVPELPTDQAAIFYIQCKPSEGEMTGMAKNGKAQAPCVVQVTVNQAASTGGAGQAGGVHVCKHRSITVRVPDKDSSVQFSCEERFTLYPTDIARVFKEDCKTEEPLKDMRRTIQAAAPPPDSDGARSPRGDNVAPTVYMLKAVEKPRKRKLCYLCATQKPTDRTAKPPEDYCAIYVESSARARPSGLGFTPLALILSSVLAVLRLT